MEWREFVDLLMVVDPDCYMAEEVKDKGVSSQWNWLMVHPFSGTGRLIENQVEGVSRWGLFQKQTLRQDEALVVYLGDDPGKH